MCHEGALTELPAPLPQWYVLSKKDVQFFCHLAVKLIVLRFFYVNVTALAQNVLTFFTKGYKILNMIKENLERIFSEISCGNNFGEKITLVGAVKTQPAELINEALRCGLTDIGDNKAQELRDNAPLITEKVIKHFFGRIQSNKLKYIVGKVELIQSVDTLSLAREISEKSKKMGITSKILLELNSANEQSKGGFSKQELINNINEIYSLDNIEVKGIMAVAPISEDNNYLARLFDDIRSLYDELKTDYPDFTTLSMGMSGDYKTAIKHGSNMIRLGTSIFGKRNYGDKL